jgi:spore coat polysaccharide biosynthesis protein SpsF (cytidylyltransferase family)
LCRITGDCPLIPPFIISAIIKSALRTRDDYVQNVDPRTRTSADGWDCEVMSAKAMSYLFTKASTKAHREHVTLLLREVRPPWLTCTHVIGFKDDSSQKISLDTDKDLEEIRSQYSLVRSKIEQAKQLNDRVLRL